MNNWILKARQNEQIRIAAADMIEIILTKIMSIISHEVNDDDEKIKEKLGQFHISEAVLKKTHFFIEDFRLIMLGSRKIPLTADSKVKGKVSPFRLDRDY